MSSVDQKISGLDSKSSSVGKNIQTVGVGLAAMGAGAVGFFGAAVNEAATFEASLSNIASVGGGEMEGMCYTSEQANATLVQIFGSDAVRAAGIFYNTNEEGWAGMKAGMENAGTVQEQAVIRLDNLQGRIEALGGCISNIMIALGRRLSQSSIRWSRPSRRWPAGSSNSPNPCERRSPSLAPVRASFS